MGCGSSEPTESPILKQNPIVKQPSKQNEKQTQIQRNQKTNWNGIEKYQARKKRDLSRYKMIMMGVNKKGPIILSLTQSLGIQVQSTKINFPRYSKAIISRQNSQIGYLTGGVDDLQVNVNEKATIDQQILQGQISKKFIQVDLGMLMVNSDNAFKILPEMITARYAHCVMEVSGWLLVIGGRQYGGNEESILRDCEGYSYEQNKWTSLPQLIQPRSQGCCIQFVSHIYVFGGCTIHNQRTRTIQSFSIGDSQWRLLPFQLPQGIQSPAIVKSVDSQTMFLFGGKTDYSKSNRVYEIDFNKSTIMSHRQMHEERCFHKIAQNGNSFYLIGGGGETIEVYDIKNQHTQVNDDISYLEYCSPKEINSFTQFHTQICLTAKKRKHQAPSFKNKVFIFGHSHQPFSKVVDCDKFTVISDGQSLYHNFYQFASTVYKLYIQATIKVNKQHAFVLGGINSHFTQVTDKVYSFNLLTEEIRYIEPMKTARYGMSAIVKGSYLYVIGGRKIGSDEVSILNHCERFSFHTHKWESIAPLKIKRQSAFSVLAGEHIVVIGGYKGNGARISDIQIYIEQQNRWVELDDKFDLAIQAMCPVLFQNHYYMFGGRNQNNDIQKVFKLSLQHYKGVKYEKSVSLELQPVGNLSYPGTNLKVFTNPQGVCYVFGNIEGGIDVYDIRKHKVIQRQQLVVFQKLKDKKFQSYTIIF